MDHLKPFNLFEAMNQDNTAYLTKIKADMDTLKMDGQNHQADLRVGKDFVSVEFRDLGNWLHDDEAHSDDEDEDDSWKEDDDAMIWAPSEYKKYMAKFLDWAKTKPWYDEKKIKLDIDTGEKSWCTFTVYVK